MPPAAPAPTGSAWPRISIVTPSYNQGRYLEATIRSVLLQGYPALEYMVIDGGSRDGSMAVVERYAAWLAHAQSEPDRGQSHAVNKGLSRATGQLLAWLNSDDILMPGALERVAAAWRADPAAVAWVGGCHRVSTRGRVLRTVRPRGLDRDAIAGWGERGFFQQPACFFAAEAWRRAGPLDESLHFAMDLDLWLRLAALGRIAAVPHVLAGARVHGGAKTRFGRGAMHEETAVVQARYGYAEDAQWRRLLAAGGGR